MHSKRTRHSRHSSMLPAPDSTCRADAQGRTNSSVRSASTARRSDPSPTNKWRWYKISPTRPSSPSRTRGCSASCGNRWSSRRATSQVLSVISSSPGALEPVFQSMLENATRICEAKIGILFRYADGAYTAVSMLGVAPAYAEYLNRGPVRPGPATALGRVTDERRTIQVVDTQAEPSLCRARTVPRRHSRARRRAQSSQCADAEGRRADRCDRHLPPGSKAFHRRAGCAGDEFRRPGRHRHRKYAAAQRVAPAHRRS